MTQRLVFYDSTGPGKHKRTSIDPANVPTTNRCNQVALTNGTSAVAISFSSAFPSTSYSLVVTLQNTIDTSPQFQPITITAQSTTGFTASWNDPLDSGNYFLNYVATTFV